MSAQENQPLWQVLQVAFEEDVGSFSLGDGFGETCGDPDASTWAQIIRVMAGWLRKQMRQRNFDPEVTSAIFRMLLAEADGGEVGE